MFFLLCRHNDDGIFNDFLKIFDHSLKINENSLKLVGRSQERCRTCFEHFQGLPMVSKDYWRMHFVFLTIQHADNLVVIRLLWIISLFSFPVYWRLIAVLYHSYCFQALLVRYILTSLLTKCQGNDPSIKELTIGKVWLTIQTVEVIHLNTWANHLNASSPRFASHFNASSYPFENFLPAVLTLPVICLKIFANHSNALPSLSPRFSNYL